LSTTDPFPSSGGPHNLPYNWIVDNEDEQVIDGDGGGGGTGSSSGNTSSTTTTEEPLTWVRELGIEFIPINTEDKEWENVAAYEIV